MPKRPPKAEAKVKIKNDNANRMFQRAVRVETDGYKGSTANGYLWWGGRDSFLLNNY